MNFLVMILSLTLGFQAHAILCQQPSQVPVDGKLQAVGSGGCKVVSDQHGVADSCALRVTKMKCQLKSGGQALVTYYSDYISTVHSPVMCLTDMKDSGFKSPQEDEQCTAMGQRAEKEPKLWVMPLDDVSNDKESLMQDRSMPAGNAFKD